MGLGRSLGPPGFGSEFALLAKMQDAMDIGLLREIDHRVFDVESLDVSPKPKTENLRTWGWRTVQGPGLWALAVAFEDSG